MANGRQNGNGSKPRNGGQRRRWDRGEAFAVFAAMPLPRTYAAVAARYGVTEGAIRRVATLEEWNQKVEALDAKAARRAEARVMRSLEERMYDNILVAEKLRETILDIDAEIHPEVAVRSLPRYVELELLSAGEATERVEIAGSVTFEDLRHKLAQHLARESNGHHELEGHAA